MDYDPEGHFPPSSSEGESIKSSFANSDVASSSSGALEYFEFDSNTDRATADDRKEDAPPPESEILMNEQDGNPIGAKKRALDDILANFSKHSADVSLDSLQAQKASRKIRSTPRVWRTIGEHFTRKECIEFLRFHRWKEPVTNSPRGSGCRVSQCALHVGCTHLLKMRLLYSV